MTWWHHGVWWHWMMFNVKVRLNGLYREEKALPGRGRLL